MPGRAGWQVLHCVTLLGGLVGLPVAAAQDTPPLPTAAPSAPLVGLTGSPRPTEPRSPAALPPIPRSAAELPSLEADPPGALAERERQRHRLTSGCWTC